MICDTCRRRFKCYTVRNRPKLVKLSYEIAKVCSDCMHFNYERKAYNQYYSSSVVGYCSQKSLLLHEHAPACESFSLKKIKQDKLEDEFKKALSKNTSGKFPKYCVEDE